MERQILLYMIMSTLCLAGLGLFVFVNLAFWKLVLLSFGLGIPLTETIQFFIILTDKKFRKDVIGVGER